jgi:hypothetical protein
VSVLALAISVLLSAAVDVLESPDAAAALEVSCPIAR